MPGGPDFDRVYLDAVAPAARDVGLVPERAGSLVSSGPVVSAVIDRIARADVMIADVSTSSPNVFYELGLRHGLSPKTTLLLAVEGSAIPFDLAGMAVLFYPVESLDLLKGRIVYALRSRLDTDSIDSPVFDLFPVEPIVLPGETGAALAHRDRVEALRAGLVEARRMPPERRADWLRSVEQDLVLVEADDDRLLTDLMLAYRDCSAWDDVIRLVASFPEPLRESRVPVQQNALAHNRRGLPGDADRATAALNGLLDRIGPDSETYGLLGRIHKDRYSRTGDRADLDAAIDAYRRGVEADPADTYPGINLATLLTLAGGADAEREVGELVPRLRALLDERRVDRTDYWDTATSLELAVIARDWSGAAELVAPTRERAAYGWMLESTVNNLEILADAMSGDRDRHEIDVLVRALAPEVELA